MFGSEQKGLSTWSSFGFPSQATSAAPIQSACSPDWEVSVIFEQIPKEHRAEPESYTDTLNCKIIARAHDKNSLGSNGYTEKMLMLKKEMTTMSREKKRLLAGKTFATSPHDYNVRNMK